MFILNCSPTNGFIALDSNVLFKFGLNKEKCLEQIHNADNKYAFSLMNSEENMITNNDDRELIRHLSDNISGRHSHSESRNRVRSIDEIMNRIRNFNSRLNCNIEY